jgi:hypothetical protein
VNLYPVINHVWTLQCDYLVRALGQRSEVATNLKCHWVHSPIAGRYGSSGAGDLRERLDRRKSPLTYRRRSPGRDDRGCDFHHTRKSHAHDRGTNMLTHCLVISSSRTISLYSTVIVHQYMFLLQIHLPERSVADCRQHTPCQRRFHLQC